MFSLIYWIIIGGIAGWIAEKVMRGNHGLLTNIVLGIIGAFVGGFIAERVPIFNFTGSVIDSIIVASLGAILVLFIYRALRK